MKKTLIVKKGKNNCREVCIQHVFGLETIAESYNDTALILIIDAASQLGWEVYDQDRNIWLCGGIGKLCGDAA